MVGVGMKLGGEVLLVMTEPDLVRRVKLLAPWAAPWLWLGLLGEGGVALGLGWTCWLALLCFQLSTEYI